MAIKLNEKLSITLDSSVETPLHIGELMCELVGGMDENNRLYDCCAGKGNVSVRAKATVYASEIETLYKPFLLHPKQIMWGNCFNIKQRSIFDCAVLNPPYSLKDKELAELKFIEHSLDVIKEGGLCAAIVPKSIFLDKNKKLRAQILQKHSLVAVITPPKDLFLEVAGTETAIGIFKSKVPHNSKIKTWLCQFDDGYDMIPKQGRIDKRGFKRLSAELVERFMNREVIPGYSNLVSIEPEMECLYDCHESTIKAVSIDFKNKLKDSVVSTLKFKLEDVINGK